MEVKYISTDELYKDYKKNTTWKVRHRDKYKLIISAYGRLLRDEIYNTGMVKLPYNLGAVFFKAQVNKIKERHKNLIRRSHYLLQIHNRFFKSGMHKLRLSHIIIKGIYKSDKAYSIALARAKKMRR